MLRSFISVYALLFFINNASADNLMDELFSNLHFGVTVIDQGVDTSIRSATSKVTTSENGNGFGIFADKYYRGKYRFNAAFSYVDYTDFNIRCLTASADYLFPYSNNITFFAGATTGAVVQAYSDDNLNYTTMGLIYGIQFGGIAYASKNLMLELGYRLRPVDLETDLDHIASTATVDQVSETYFSFLMMF